MFLLLLGCACAKPICLGLGSKETETTCRKIKNENDCIGKNVVDTGNFTASCIWHENQKAIVKDVQKLSSQGAPMGILGLDYRGSLCGLKMKVELPKSASSRWGANVRLRGGPSDSSEWYSTTSPDIMMSSSGCTASKGAPLECTAEIVAPKKKYALEPEFKKNSATIDFFTSDKSRIKAWKDNQVLDKDQTLDVRTTYEFLKCGVKGVSDPSAPEISDSVWFGITSYQMYENFDRGFFDLSYRTYKLNRTKSVTWDFDVSKTLGKKQPTKLVTFLMKEDDYQKWSAKCIQCYAPTELAIKNTLCEGTKCSVEKKYLGWKNGEYRIFIGFPEVCNAYNDKCYDENSPSGLKNGYTKELVNINIYPKLKLPTASSSSSRFVVPGGNAKTSLYDDEKYIRDYSSRGIIVLQ